MMNKNQFIVATLIWFIGLPVSIVISYVLRKIGDFNTLGMPEVVWFAMHLGIYISSIVLILFSIKELTVLKKMASVIILSLIYAVYYFIITWFYITESGIDSV